MSPKATPTFKDHPVSVALRAEGFIPLPRLWVKPEDMAEIAKMAQRHKDRVNDIRSEVHRKHPELGDQRPPFHKNKLVETDFAKLEKVITSKAMTDKEAAWEAYERSRNASTA